MTERLTISRRAAIEAMLVGGGTIFAALYAPRVLETLNPSEKTVSPADKSMPAGKRETPAPTATTTNGGPIQTSTADRSIQDEEKPTASPTTEIWKIPTIEERKAFFANPDFFMKPQDSSGKIILTPQFADSEWERLIDKTRFYSCDFKGHGCGASVIATIVKAMGFFHDGKVPDITNADVINFLMDKDHDGYHMIWPNNIAMQDDPLKWSIDLYGQKTGMFSTARLTPDWGLSNNHIVPNSEWAGLFSVARKNVLDKGGLVVARVLKYGRPPGTFGHFIIISSFNRGGEPLIVDSIGPYKDHRRQGDARTIGLETYVEKAHTAIPELKDRPGLFWMAGVIPTF